MAGPRVFLGMYGAARDGDKTCCGVPAETTQTSVHVDKMIAHVEGDPVNCYKPGCTHTHELVDSRAKHVFIGGKPIYVAK
jgi:uncharacterized Zn-binding protein involved in type VI secretion